MIRVVKKVEGRLVAIQQSMVVDLHLFLAALPSQLVEGADVRQHLLDGHHELVGIPERVEDDGEHCQWDDEVSPVESVLAHGGGVAKVERGTPDVRVTEQRAGDGMVDAALVRIRHRPKVTRPDEGIDSQLAEREIEKA